MKHREPLRKGKWTIEEEEYTAGIINHFTKGLLKLPEGTTLRAYLAEKLNCDPMRITKKFTGGSCLGKRVYHPPDDPSISSEEVERARQELGELESRFLVRLERNKDRNNTLLAYDARFFNRSNVVSTPGIDAMLFGQGGGGGGPARGGDPLMLAPAGLQSMFQGGGGGSWGGALGGGGEPHWGEPSSHPLPPHNGHHHHHHLPPPSCSLPFVLTRQGPQWRERHAHRGPARGRATYATTARLPAWY